jgi:CheY-like chemotaxis protein
MQQQEATLFSRRPNDQMEMPRLLLVEDNLVLQQVHRIMLEKMHFTVDVAGNGQQTLALYHPGRYALVVLDGGLPDTTGFDLALLIRNRDLPDQPPQPLILLSAYPYDEVKMHCESVGIVDFAIKPVAFETLEKMVLKVLGEARNFFLTNLGSYHENQQQ